MKSFFFKVLKLFKVRHLSTPFKVRHTPFKVESDKFRF